MEQETQGPGHRKQRAHLGQHALAYPESIYTPPEASLQPGPPEKRAASRQVVPPGLEESSPPLDPSLDSSLFLWGGTASSGEEGCGWRDGEPEMLVSSEVK